VDSSTHYPQRDARGSIAVERGSLISLPSFLFDVASETNGSPTDDHDTDIYDGSNVIMTPHTWSALVVAPSEG